jgi:predicted aldo/keto reductase-like oxidoreductase
MPMTGKWRKSSQHPGGLCMKHCPQMLKIPDLLKKIRTEFTE